MIGYIKGTLIHHDGTSVILETGGIGYEMMCSATLYARLVQNMGGEAYTYLAVKEDGISL